MLALLGLCYPRAPATAADSPGARAPLIDQVMRALAAVPEGRATFVETKSLAALTAPVTETGTLYFRRPAHFEKITISPDPERLVVDGDQLTLSLSAESSRRFDLASDPGLRALVDAIRGTLAGDLALLRRSWQVAMTGEFGLWRLTLMPLTAARALTPRQIVIDGSDASVREINIIQANNDASRMTIHPAP